MTHALLTAAPWLGLTLALFVAQYLLRRFAPNFWEWCANIPFGDPVDRTAAVTYARRAWQALPSVVGGAVLVALFTHANVHLAAWGALAGLGAPLLHHLAKWLPWLPYMGATNTGKLDVSALIVLLLCGCAPAHTAAEEADEDKCIARVAAAAQVEIAKRCDTAHFAECPEHDAIMQQWEAEARRCQRP